MRSNSLSGIISVETIDRFWNQLVIFKLQACYLERYFHYCYNINNNLNIFLALTSSGAIAAWVIWNTYPFNLVWAGIIAASQVINAVKAYLPWGGRLKPLAATSMGLHYITLDAEDAWFKVSNTFLTEEEIHALTSTLRKRAADLQRANFGENPLPENTKLLQRGEDDAARYFSRQYDAEIERFSDDDNRAWSSGRPHDASTANQDKKAASQAT